MFIVKMADHDGNHSCVVEKNVPIPFILHNRCQNGTESLGMETKRAVYGSGFVSHVLIGQRY